jgi:uncharacterized protein
MSHSLRSPSPLVIDPVSRRRFILGLHGLYPGRRWSGKEGIVSAIAAIGGLQIDPLNVVARSHDITMWGRVRDYRTADLDALLYKERALFDWGGTVFIYPIQDLPHWRVVMERRKETGRYQKFIAAHGPVMDAVRETIRERGPMASADFTGAKVQLANTYRGTKDTGQALYYLWLTGEIMTHSRRNNQRVYDLTERVAPPEWQHVSSDADADDYLTRLLWAQFGIVTTRRWDYVLRWTFERPLEAGEASRRLEAMRASGEITPVKIDSSKDTHYILTENLPLLEAVQRGEIPPEWRPLDTTTDDEAVFLAPLDMVSARGRAKTLFDFDYIWEVYKPAEKRRWGYYTLPVLYQDRLVARIDPKLDRPTKTLQIKGLWLEPEVSGGDPVFAAAMARGLRNFAAFTGAQHVDPSAIQPESVRQWAESLL